MVAVLVDSFLSNCEMYEHRCLENIYKIYTSTGKCDDQVQFKAVVDAPMFSTP